MEKMRVVAVRGPVDVIRKDSAAFRQANAWGIVEPLDWIERYSIPASHLKSYQSLRCEDHRQKALKPKKSRTAWLSVLLCGLKRPAEVVEDGRIKRHWTPIKPSMSLRVESPTEVHYRPSHELRMDYPGEWSKNGEWQWRLITVHRPLDWDRIVVVYLHVKDLGESLKLCVPWEEATQVDAGEDKSYEYSRWTGSRKAGEPSWQATIAVTKKHGDTSELKTMMKSDLSSVVNGENVTNAWLQQRAGKKYTNMMLYQRYVTFGNELTNQCMELWDDSMAGDFESFVEPLLPESETRPLLPKWAW